MAKRCFRLKKSKEIARIYKCGKRAFSETVTLVYFSARETRYAVCVGKKYGKSVERNRIKRLLREAFACYAQSVKPAYDILLIPKVRNDYSFRFFVRDVGKLLKREKLLENRVTAPFEG